MVLMYIFMLLEAVSLCLLTVRVRRLEMAERTVEKNSDRKAEELERAWNEGVSGILGYDLEKAKGALKFNERE